MTDAGYVRCLDGFATNKSGAHASAQAVVRLIHEDQTRPLVPDSHEVLHRPPSRRRRNSRIGDRDWDMGDILAMAVIDGRSATSAPGRSDTSARVTERERAHLLRA